MTTADEQTTATPPTEIAPPTAKADGKKAAKALVVGTLFGAAGAAFGIGAVKLARSTGVMPDLDTDWFTLWDLALLPVAMFVVILVHELGHLAGGMARGMKFLMLVVGPVQILRARSGVTVGFNRRGDLWGGLAACLPERVDHTTMSKFSLMVAGGPLASLLLGIIALAIGQGAEGRLGGWASITGLISLGIFLVTILPFKAGGFRSDGLQLLDTFRGNETVGVRAAAMAIMAQSMAGVRPRDLDRSLIQPLLEIKDKTMRLAGLMIEAGRAMDAGEDAGPAVAEIARDWLAYPDGFRHELAAVVAAWMAGPGGNVAAAEPWLVEARKGPDTSGWVGLAEVTVAAAKGERSAYAEAAAKARARLDTLPESGNTVFMTEWMDALDTRMTGASAA